MSARSYFSSRVVREANAMLVASGTQKVIALPRELLGVITSTRKTRSELKAAFELAYSQIRSE
ncbi:hypothetical protein D3C76_674960 [compost metagenome]